MPFVDVSPSSLHGLQSGSILFQPAFESSHATVLDVCDVLTSATQAPGMRL